MLNFFRSKKGDVSITILVILCVVACIGSLFIFVTNKNTFDSAEFNPALVSNLYAYEEGFDFYIRSLISASLDKTFKENVADFDNYLLTEDFKVRLEENVIVAVDRDCPEYYFDLCDKFRKSEIRMRVEKDINEKSILLFEIRDLEFNLKQDYSDSEVISVIHNKDLKFEFDLDEKLRGL